MTWRVMCWSGVGIGTPFRRTRQAVLTWEAAIPTDRHHLKPALVPTGLNVAAAEPLLELERHEQLAATFFHQGTRSTISAFAASEEFSNRSCGKSLPPLPMQLWLRGVLRLACAWP